MDRRRFLLTSLAGVIGAPLAAGAQQAGKVSIRVLHLGSAASFRPYVNSFREGVREHGHIEGESVAIHLRSADDQADRLPPLVAELLALNVRVIVTSGTTSIQAAKNATKTAMARDKADAVVVLEDPSFVAHAQKIADLALYDRLPTMLGNRLYVHAGGLMAYGPVHEDLGSIGGTVSGGALKFNRVDGRLLGDVIVAEDEMSGTATWGTGGTKTLRLRRVPVGYSYQLAHLRMIGWQLFAEASVVQWCGHAQHLLVVPHADGVRAALVPIFGKALA